ncbi:type IV pilus biogenesis protein PilM [Bacillus sp. B1-b2]|uniref:type IV pilus biogenesis protein PilM n=1 Tax=Bacillus sp. B1-b2 TaxID=2653201 RepID=UPI001261D371|nr:pilus assembly protein PilM [Bacillus sp. B1-b2]KAB7667340.1 pilus assembly protein PilM [Bacillus sp. B1-b2]
MALNLNLGKKKVVNLTIKDHVIRYAELKNSQDSTVQNWGERYLPTGLIHEGIIQDLENFTWILEECIDEWKILKKQVRFLVPDSSIVIRKLSIPEDASEDEIKGYLYMELGTSIHLPFEDPVFDYFLLKEKDKNKKQIILFASPESNVSQYADILDEAKLDPVSADISALALYRYYYHQNAVENTEPVMLVEIDTKTVNASIFEEHYPLLMRHLMMEVDEQNWTISTDEATEREYLTFTGDKAEVWDSLEDIYKELEKVMSFYRYTLNKGNKQVTKLVVAGDHPWLPSIVEHMKDRFEVSVQEMKVNQTANNEPIPSSLLLNIGLGLKEV